MKCSMDIRDRFVPLKLAPENVKSIFDYAFSGCSTMPSSILEVATHHGKIGIGAQHLGHQHILIYRSATTVSVRSVI